MPSISTSISAFFKKPAPREAQHPEQHKQETDLFAAASTPARESLTNIPEADAHVLKFLSQIDGLNLRLVSRTIKKNVDTLNPKHKIAGIGEVKLRKTLRGHKHPISALAITIIHDNKKLLATGAWDGTVKIWDFDTGTCLHTLRGPIAPVTPFAVSSIAITPDGKIVTAYEDASANIWDLATGALLHRLEEHAEIITSLVIVSTPNKYLITGSHDGTAKIWSTETGNLIHTLGNDDRVGFDMFNPFVGSQKGIGSLAITPNGEQLVTGSNDKTAKIWDIATGTLLHTLQGHTGGIRSLAISTDGRKLVTGSIDNTAKIWDIATGTLLRTLQGHTHWISSLAITPGGKIVTGSWDNTAKIWDIDTGNLIHTLEGHTEDISALAVLPNKYLITTSSDKTAKIWDITSGTLLHTLRGLRGHTRSIKSLAITSDGKQLVTVSHDKTAKIWDIERIPWHEHDDASASSPSLIKNKIEKKS